MVVSTPAIARTGPIDRMYGGPEIINRREVPSDTFHLNYYYDSLVCLLIMIHIISND